MNVFFPPPLTSIVLDSRLHPQSHLIVRKLACSAAVESPGGAKFEAPSGQPPARQDDALGAHVGQEARRREQDETGVSAKGARGYDFLLDPRRVHDPSYESCSFRFRLGELRGVVLQVLSDVEGRQQLHSVQAERPADRGRRRHRVGNGVPVRLGAYEALQDPAEQGHRRSKCEGTFPQVTLAFCNYVSPKYVT